MLRGIGPYIQALRAIGVNDTTPGMFLKMGLPGEALATTVPPTLVQAIAMLTLPMNPHIVDVGAHRAAASPPRNHTEALQWLLGDPHTRLSPLTPLRLAPLRCPQWRLNLPPEPYRRMATRAVVR